MDDLGRIKRNVAKMAQMDTPESDIDGYIKSENVTIEQVRDYSPEKFSYPEKERGFAGSKGRAFSQGVSSAVPFGNEITSQIASAALAPFSNMTRRELLEQSRADTAATAKEHPYYQGGGLAAGIGATIPLGMTKGAIKIGEMARQGGLASRAAKGAALTAPTAGLYGAGEAQEGERREGFIKGAALGAGLGAGLPVAAATVGGVGGGVKSIYKGFKARDVEALESAGEFIKNKSRKAYSKMREIGADLSDTSSIDIAKKLNKDLLDDGKLNSRLHGKVIGLVEDFNDDISKGTSLESLDQWRQLFSDVAGDFNDKINGRKASIMVSSIDDAITNIKNTDLIDGSVDAISSLRVGQSEWARQSKFSKITDIIKKADGDANYIKRELKKFLDNPKKTRGFSQEELIALGRAATLTGGEGVMKMLGRFGFDLGKSRIGSGVGALVGSAGSGAAFGGVGAVAAPVVGTASRYGHKAITRSKAEDLLSVIEGVPIRDIMKLTPKEAKKILNRRK